MASNLAIDYEKASDEILQQLIQSCKPSVLRSALPQKSFPEWCKTVNIDGHKFSFKKREYLIKPYHDEHPWQVDQKATQIGGTVRAILRAIYGARYSGFRNILYYFPSKTHVLEFSKGRIKPLIEENPDIQAWVRATDSASIKQIWESFLYLLGMNSTIEVKNIPANMLVFDEFDEAPQGNFDKAIERLGGQMDAEEVAVHMLSNPTLPDYGVTREFLQTDQQHYLLKCSAGHRVCMEDAFIAWTEGKDESPLSREGGPNGSRVCPKCHGILNPARGEWVAKRKEVKDKRGYHFSQLFSQTFMHSPAKILDKWDKAQKTGNLTDFWNLTIGIGFVESENRLSIEDVLECCGYSGIADRDPGPCSMGIDQNKGIHVVISRKHQVMDAQVIHLGIYEDWEQLYPLMDRFNVSRCVVDALPETRNARKMANAFPGRVFLCYYNRHQKGSYAWDEKDYKVSVNRTESLDNSHYDLKDQKIILPKRCGIVDEFADHCHNTAKRLEEVEETDQKTRMKRKTGEKRYVYVPLGSGVDHFRHSFNYEAIARSGAPNHPLFPGM